MHVARPSVLSVVAVSLLAIAACNTGDTLGNQANVPPGADLGEVEDGGAVVEPIDAGDNGAPSDVYPAPFMAPPEVMRSGGPVLDEPRFVPVFFSNDDMTLVPRVFDYEKKVATSNYWKEVTSEYGVGPATVTNPVVLSETATGTIDDSKIRTWLAAKLNAGDPAFPAPTTDDIVVLHYPSTATITLTSSGGQVSRSCREFGAYHGDTQLDNAHNRMRVAYAVIPRCRSQGSTFDTMTLSESHELIEAATDPYPRTNPAYSSLESDYYHWQALTSGGEVSDLCQISFDSDIRPAELGYVVQRSWSNAAAKAGSNPVRPRDRHLLRRRARARRRGLHRVLLQRLPLLRARRVHSRGPEEDHHARPLQQRPHHALHHQRAQHPQRQLSVVLARPQPWRQR